MSKQPPQLHSVSNITATAALEIVRAAFDEAKKIGVNISVAVVDVSLNLVAFCRGDGATPHSIETSRRKANTSASTGKVTGWINQDLITVLPMASGNLLTNLPGGVPLRFNRVLGGGLGIAGGTVEQDAVIAQAVVVVVGADGL